MSRLLTWIALSISLVLSPAFATESPAPIGREQLERALSRYAEALAEPDRDDRIAIFAEAEVGFAAVIEAGVENAALQTNLGNAALQAEHVGPAVLAYHRALQLDPDAATPRQNLAHIRTLLPGWVPRPTPQESARTLLFYRALSPANRSHVAAACFAFAGACFAISLRRRNGAWRGVALSAGLAWMLLMASVVFDSNLEDANLAVITADEALARSADSRLAALAYPEPLPSGTEVEMLEERAEWARVRLHNGRDVWVHRSDVAKVVE